MLDVTSSAVQWDNRRLLMHPTACGKRSKILRSTGRRSSAVIRVLRTLQVNAQ